MLRKRVFLGFVIVMILCLLENKALPNKPKQELCIKSDVYNSSKYCSLRGNYYSQLFWNYYVGFLCYNYSNNARFTNKYKSDMTYDFTCNGNDFRLPVALVNDSTIALYDYKEAESADLLRKSFKSEELFNNYLKCCKEAEDCCSQFMTDTNIISTRDECPVVWDGWSCFPNTAVNTTKTLQCSSQVYESPDNVCTLESKKECYWNGTLELALWNQQTDYSSCKIAPVYQGRYEYYVIALIISVVCSFPAIVIFVTIPSLRNTKRVIFHRNLLITLVVRNILNILLKQLVLIDALLTPAQTRGVMEGNSVWCRTLSFFSSSAMNSVYACMLVDGYYLHKVIVRTFAKEPHMITIYVVITVLTFLPSLIWATILGVKHRISCWVVDTNGEQWSVDSFRLLILIINAVLLLDIIRIMLSKMKQGNTTTQTMAAFRATLFLIPLFGLQFLITAKKTVINDTCFAEDIYEYFRYTMEAAQGMFVAILFCYANTEVHNELKNVYRKLIIHLHQRYGWNIGGNNFSRRRTTTGTYVGARGSNNQF
ncbi:corticotropin-releasing factor receptor 2-like [Euwallacea fornicatus]|uniref:corticotropin-releasing factor receptor 2-like n=1 Tax=Euwallacea fornicatus TaxID=995702 RepID=UPI00338DF81B